MKIDPISRTLPGLQVQQTGNKTQPGFQEYLTEAFGKVNTLQNEAHKAMEDLATGKTANTHETMVAIQKADISFKMLMQVRGKVISAYQEIMRMSV